MFKALSIAYLQYFIGAFIYFISETYFILNMRTNNPAKAWWWAALSIVATPMLMNAVWSIYQCCPSWGAVHFPYWLISIFVTYVMFRFALSTSVGWREGVSAVLILIIACLLGWR